MLPRFGGLTDREVLQHDFKLSDAQELIARQAGFESWQALKFGVATMPAVDHRTALPALTKLEAQLFVTDIKAACTWYAKLGFDVVFTYGDPPFYGQVKCGEVRLNLRYICEPVFVDDIRERESLLSASISVETPAEIRDLFLRYQAAGVEFHQTLKQEPWGARDFVVRDPDGNLLLFGAPTG